MRLTAPILICGSITLIACAPAGPAPTDPGAARPRDAGAAHAPAATPAPRPGVPARSFAAFLPSRDGFAFVNSFSGSPLPIDLGAAAETSLGLPRRYGLCGGMSSAAADYFLAGAPPPADARPPARGSPLYTYLYRRQAASVGPAGAMALKFLQWMRLPDDGADGTRARTAAELPAIRAALGRGEPVLLGLVLTTAARNPEPWHNHQVLAYARRTTPDGVEEILIYDPNFPRRDDAALRIATEHGLPRYTRVVPGRRDTPVRGLFRMPYTPARPTIARTNTKP